MLKMVENVVVEAKKVVCPVCKSEDIKNYPTYKSCNSCGKNFK